LAQFARDHASQSELAVGKNNSGKDQIPRYQVVGDERRPGQYVDRYDAEIRGFDAQLGRLFAWLKQNEMWDDALIVFSADHGEELGDHGYWFCHGETLNRELVRVPLIVRAPNSLQASARVEKRLATHLDVWPTVLEAFALPPIENRGVSLLLPALPEDRVCAQFLGPLRNPGRRLAITDGRWRLVLVAEDPPRLFDLQNDAGELHDLAVEKPDVVDTLRKRYLAYMSTGTTGHLDGVPRKMDATATRAMQGLGYTEGDGDGH
jgi:arylsulfatase A-like enzyme